MPTSSARQGLCSAFTGCMLVRLPQTSSSAPRRCLRRVVEELASLRKSIRSLDEDKAAHLSSLLCGLASCVSLIRQNTHHSLLTEIFGFPVWGLPEVFFLFLSSLQSLFARPLFCAEQDASEQTDPEALHC